MVSWLKFIYWKRNPNVSVSTPFGDILRVFFKYPRRMIGSPSWILGQISSFKAYMIACLTIVKSDSVTSYILSASYMSSSSSLFCVSRFELASENWIGATEELTDTRISFQSATSHFCRHPGSLIRSIMSANIDFIQVDQTSRFAIFSHYQGKELLTRCTAGQ